MYSSSHLHGYASDLHAISRELDREDSVEGTMNNRQRFLAVYKNMQAEAASYTDADNMLLLREAHALNPAHRSSCLKLLKRLKEVQNLDARDKKPSRDTKTSDCGNDCSTRRQLKMHYTSILKAWIDNHADNPFPSKKEKAELCMKASITERQLNNWFTNYRRRHRAI